MKPLKTGIMVLLFVSIFLGLYFYFKLFVPERDSTSISTSAPEENFAKEFAEKLETRAPLRWVPISKESLQAPEAEPESPKTSYTDNSTIQDLFKELQGLKWQDFGFGPSPINQNEVVSVEVLEGYSRKLLEAWSRNSFTEEEFQSIKKNKDGRVLSLEELMQEAATGADLEELKPSFRAWQMLGERTVGDLKNISVNSQLSFAHQSMISWLEYYVQVAEKLSKENLSREEINTLFNQYLEKAKIETPKFQSVLVSKRNPPVISLIPEANAQFEVFYHFGGLIVSYIDFCTNGFAIAVEGVKGGELWIYYPVYFANPYLYKILAPEYETLGRAIWGPGTCNKGKLNYPQGQAQIIFFGSSAIPGG